MRTIKAVGVMLLTISCLFGMASPSSGQTAYGGASLTGDIVRTSQANQAVTERVSLVYLGGVAFNRFSREYGYAFDVLPALMSVSRTVRYSTRPVVGFESWIGLTDSVTLMPGLRLLGVEGGWSIRPAVGIGWSF